MAKDEREMRDALRNIFNMTFPLVCAKTRTVEEAVLSILTQNEAAKAALRELSPRELEALAEALRHPALSEWSGAVTITTPADWRTEAWRARALLLAALYFTLTAAAEFEFKGDILNKLEAHLIAALAIWGYFAERNRRKDR